MLTWRRGTANTSRGQRKPRLTVRSQIESLNLCHNRSYECKFLSRFTNRTKYIKKLNPEGNVHFTMRGCAHSMSDATLPQLWWRLSEADKYQYTCLKAAISSTSLRSQRNRRVTTFTEALSAIKAFVIRGDNDDGLRSLVCGICWLKEGIAINTHQLKRLLSKCKSSINGSLQKLGYTTSLGRTESAAAMVSVWPLLRENSAELRKWTVRRRDDTHSYEDKLDSPPPRAHSTGPFFEISLDGLARPQRKETVVDLDDQPFGEFDIGSSSQAWDPSVFSDLSFEDTFLFK